MIVSTSERTRASWEIPGPGGVSRLSIERVPLLRRHAGDPPDVILRWANVGRAASAIDVVVHLHGYADHPGPVRLASEKEPASGLDAVDPRTGSPGRRDPILMILPRGHHAPTSNRSRHTFPMLTTPQGLRELVDFCLARLRTQIGAPNLRARRLILTAHSGGGAAVEAALAHNDPDEIHIFDGLYSPSPRLIRWAERHIDCDQAGCGRPSGALRVLYLAGTPTERESRAVRRAVVTRLAARPGSSAAIARRYRVEAIPTRRGVSHSNMPVLFGWRLLADPSADLPLPGGAAPTLPKGPRSPARRPARGTRLSGPAQPVRTPAVDPAVPSNFRPAPVECPGGGRITDKRPPTDIVHVRGAAGSRVPLHATAAVALTAMIQSARADGIPDPVLRVSSGYRSPQTQAILWAQGLKKHGSPEAARRWIAPPGSSPHQSGRAVDLYLGVRSGSGNVRAQRATPAYGWLRSNAARFGFYPYHVEPWHWEYNPANPGCR